MTSNVYEKKRGRFNEVYLIIELTRGDTFTGRIGMEYEDSNPYTPEDGDKIRFAVKKDYCDEEVLINKEIDPEELTFTINPEDTNELCFGEYHFDVEITHANGSVDTFIREGTLLITPEVH